MQSTETVPMAMRAPVTTPELFALLSVRSLAARLLELHDDQVFVCGEGDQGRVDTALGELREAVEHFNRLVSP
jgi:hypothetical protein